MSALEQVSVAALENQAFALMARLHVILRRQHGRITDVEYMRQDPAYCRHVIDLAMKDASEEVAGICARLEAVFFGPEGLFVRIPREPLLSAAPAKYAQVRPQFQARLEDFSPMTPAASTASIVSSVSKIDPDFGESPRVESSYVGRLR